MLKDPRYREAKWAPTGSGYKIGARGEVEKLEPKKTALFIVDMQKGFCLSEYAPILGTLKKVAPEDFDYWMNRLKVVVPNLRRLQDLFRRHGLEVIQCVDCSVTPDGRDRTSPFFAKGRGIQFASGSKEAEVLDELQPLPNELLLTKTTASVFANYNTYLVLQNMGIEYLVFGGILTDDSVLATVLNAGLFGAKIVVVEDGCGAYSERDHVSAIRKMNGGVTITSTEYVLSHLSQ